MPPLGAGSLVILSSMPSGLLDGLPGEDQLAIRSIIGQPVTLAGYSFGQAELEFDDASGNSHSIWVEPSLLQAA